MFKASLPMSVLLLSFCMVLLTISSLWTMEILARGSMLYVNAVAYQIFGLFLLISFQIKGFLFV